MNECSGVRAPEWVSKPVETWPNEARSCWDMVAEWAIRRQKRLENEGKRETA